MKASHDEMMKELAVPRRLEAYEDHLWTCYDGEQGLTCTAEVRLSAAAEALEAEMQLMYDTPPEGGLPIRQIMILKAQQDVPGSFSVKALNVLGDNMVNEGYNWGGRSCKFWRACIECLERDEIPDFEALRDSEMEEEGRFADQWGDGGGRSPKIRPGQLTGMKKGGGF